MFNYLTNLCLAFHLWHIMAFESVFDGILRGCKDAKHAADLKGAANFNTGKLSPFYK